MQCKCGGVITDSVHEVKTYLAGKSWWPKLKEKDLPIKIHQNKCYSCTRLSYKVEDNKKKIVFKHN